MEVIYGELKHTIRFGIEWHLEVAFKVNHIQILQITEMSRIRAYATIKQQ